ncbi:DUF1043 family protein [Thauera sp.]|uniref:YhcB family protein n=1 Tax=Thauera sp. TaxID=1905334 RepID=UPI002639BBAF|nr:DUF1043 family protein [Thauera sp.]MCK6409925.1 YhcB family protein [Thauera sp.]
MTPQTAWLLAISAVVIVGVVAFFVGRGTAGTKARIEELEAELARKRAEVDDYRKDVETHIDKTATLFVSMAGSYRELFEHLSAGYDKLATGTGRDRFQQRVDALLVGRPAAAVPAAGALLAGAAVAAAETSAAAPVTVAAVEPAMAVATTASAGEGGALADDAAAGAVEPAASPAPEAAADDIVRRAEGVAQEPDAGVAASAPAPGNDAR